MPWALARGEARLQGKGRLRVRVAGLVIPPPDGDNTARSVATISASIFCGDSTTAAATTSAVALSQSGNARIDQRVTIAGPCLAPVVLVHPNGGVARYIAASGFGRRPSTTRDQSHHAGASPASTLESGAAPARRSASPVISTTATP